MKKGKNKMGNPDFKQPVKELIDEVKRYIDMQLEYNKVAYRKKSAEMVAQLLLVFMIFGIFVFVLMFLSFAFVNWYATVGGGTRTGGFLWVTAFYLLLALIIYAFKEPLIFSNVRKILGKNLSSTREKQFLAGSGFANEKMTDKYLEHLRDENRKQENSVQHKWQTVNETFNLVNIAKAMIHSGVQAFATTRNVIQTALQVSKKLKSRRGKNRDKGQDRGKDIAKNQIENQ